MNSAQTPQTDHETGTSSTDQQTAGPAVDAEVIKPKRLRSLDAYRGFIMIMLASAGFGIRSLAQLPKDAPVWHELNYEFWQQLSFHFYYHPPWTSRFGLIDISFWDLIQPAFMFMVGVAMPYSYARRETLGHSKWRRLAHAVWRGLVLTLIGVFLTSQGSPSTKWDFTNVLSQIGLGYVFLYLLMGRHVRVQWAAFAIILVGYWILFESYTPPEDYDYAAVNASGEMIFEGRFASWSKNANIASQFDRWFLNQFPRPNGEPFRFDPGGYTTLNFVPSIATMLLGVFAGQLLRSHHRPWNKFLILIASGAVCMVLGVVAGELICPIVKRIWTPSWVLFSGGWVVWMLAAFYMVFDLFPLRWLAFPLVVVGMNSIAVYLMGSLMHSWTQKMINIHFHGLLVWFLGEGALADDMYGRVVGPTTVLVIFWLIALWMYRQKFFIRM
jgi:predicted acyltransferase